MLATPVDDSVDFRPGDIMFDFRPSGITSLDVRLKPIQISASPHVSMVNSGSSANLLAISALTNPRYGRLRPGDEVIVSALSWSTTVWPLVQHGLVPVIVDIDPETLNIDVGKAEKAVSEKTRAIMPVHVYGNPCDMREIMRLCFDKNLLLIEDCCEALGATYDGEPVGTFGIVGTFSFYFSHHMTTLEGGACVTSEKELDELMRILRAHGWTRDVDDRKYRLAYPEIDPKFLFVNVGNNLRATELQAAIGLVQMRKLCGFVEARRRAAEGLKSVFEPYQDLNIQIETEGGESSWFGFPVVVTSRARFKPYELRAHLENNGIETRSIICGNIADQPGMKLWEHRVPEPCLEARWAMDQGFSIGCHQDVGEEQIEHIRNVLRALYG